MNDGLRSLEQIKRVGIEPIACLGQYDTHPIARFNERAALSALTILRLAREAA